MSDAPTEPRTRIRRVRRAVATTAVVVFLGAWAAVGALGRGAEATQAASSPAATREATDPGAGGGAASQAGTLPDVVTSQS
jgi:hypothetical protein